MESAAMTSKPGTNDVPAAVAGTEPPRRIERRIVEVILTAVVLACLTGSLICEAAGWSIKLQLALNVLSYIAGGWFGVIDAIPTLRRWRIDINILMVVAAIGAAVIDQWHEGATLLFLFSLSNTLQSFAMERSRNAIAKLLKLRPSTAALLRDGAEVRVRLEELRPGDRVLVRPGEILPTDGVVRRGQSDVDQASITGESRPVDKTTGDPVFAGTMNGSGAIEVEVGRAAADSTLSKIIHLVESAQQRKSRTQRFFERFEHAYAVLVVLGALAAILIPWLALGTPFDSSLYRGMVLLVVASPCALIISTPAATLSAIANAASRGVLFKGGAYLESLAAVRVAAFDKTGTLTSGKLRVTDVVADSRRGATTAARAADESRAADDRLLAMAAVLESRSEHPIARAIVAAATQRGLTLPPLSEFKARAGRGVSARVEEHLYWFGGEQMYREHGETVPPHIADEKSRLEREGKTVLILHRELERHAGVGTHESDGGWMGVIAVADSPRPQAGQAVARLKALGVNHVVMLTGDNPAVAAAVAGQVGVDEFLADLLPEDKVAAVQRLRDRHGPILMVGDGVNDAPALAAADVGAAMGAAGSDAAIETADMVVMADRIENIPAAVSLSRDARRIVLQNITFSLAVIAALVIGVLAANLRLPYGVVGHEGSTLIVVANGLRLLRSRPAP